MEKELGEYIEFDVPIGGMAVWCKLNANYSWDRISELATKYKLEINSRLYYDHLDKDHAFLRIGFAKHNQTEIRELIKRFKKLILALC